MIIDAIRDSKFLYPAIILATGIGISVVFFLSTPEPATRDIKPPVILVDAIEISRSPLTMTVDTQGEVIARTRTTLVSEVSGVVTSISDSFVAGAGFDKGEQLLTIDDRNYVAELERARANVAGARKKLAEEVGLAEYAAVDWEKSRVGTAPSDLALRKPHIEEARANLEFALADLKRKQGDLERTRVTAYYDGMVESREVDVGQYVSPGTRLGVVFAIDVVEVRLPIPLHELEFLDLPSSIAETKEPVPVALTSITRSHVSNWPAHIVRTEAVMDRKNRVLYAIAEVRDPYTGHDSPLRIGSFVRARISGRYYDDIVRIPRAAVRPGNNIWIVNADSQLERRTIDPIRADENYLYVEAGVSDGDIISVTPLENPLPGTEVSFTLQSEMALSAQ